MTEKIRPLGEWVVIQPDKAETQTAGGLHLPQTAKKRTRRATVMAVGPGKMLECGTRAPQEVSVGDRVTFLEHNIAQGVRWVDDENGPCLIPGSEINSVIMNVVEAGVPAPAHEADAVRKARQQVVDILEHNYSSTKGSRT